MNNFIVKSYSYYRAYRERDESRRSDLKWHATKEMLACSCSLYITYMVGILIKVYAERNVFAKLRGHITSTFNGAVKQIVICEQIFRVEIVFKIFLIYLKNAHRLHYMIIFYCTNYKNEHVWYKHRKIKPNGGYINKLFKWKKLQKLVHIVNQTIPRRKPFVKYSPFDRLASGHDNGMSCLSIYRP